MSRIDDLLTTIRRYRSIVRSLWPVKCWSERRWKNHRLEIKELCVSVDGQELLYDVNLDELNRI
jgi:hypothetical protein